MDVSSGGVEKAQFQPMISGAAIIILLSFDEKVPKDWLTSYLQRRCKCQPIPSKNCCINICASLLCVTTLASWLLSHNCP